MLYNSGTWGLTTTAEKRLNSFHRSQLRSLLGITWPETINNKAFYSRCQDKPLRLLVKRSRWRLFGHILRMPVDTPAVSAMTNCFHVRNEKKWKGRPRMTLPLKLHDDLAHVRQGTFKSIQDLVKLTSLAGDRNTWRCLINDICTG